MLCVYPNIKKSAHCQAAWVLQVIGCLITSISKEKLKKVPLGGLLYILFSLDQLDQHSCQGPS